MIWPFKKRTFEERKQKLENLLAKHSKKWTHIEYGQYVYKPILLRAVTYILGIDESRSRALITAGKIRLNNKPALDPQERLESGKYVLFLEENGYYEFFIK